MNQLTPRQQTFVENYVRLGNGAEAAREAGYKPLGARVRAHRLLTKDNVQASIRQCQSSYRGQMGLSRDQVITELQEAAALAKARGNPEAMISAWREIARVCGFYETDSTGGTKAARDGTRYATLIQLSDTELLNLLQ